jgi:hypothetical protein
VNNLDGKLSIDDKLASSSEDGDQIQTTAVRHIEDRRIYRRGFNNLYVEMLHLEV